MQVTATSTPSRGCVASRNRPFSKPPSPASNSKKSLMRGDLVMANPRAAPCDCPDNGFHSAAVPVPYLASALLKT